MPATSVPGQDPVTLSCSPTPTMSFVQDGSRPWFMPFRKPTWPEGHGPRVAELLAWLGRRDDLALAPLDWSSGVLVAARRTG